MEESVEDDYAQLVGVSTSLYLLTALVMLLAGQAGWIASWMNLAALLSVLVLNAKLIHIIRFACRGGAVNDLTRNAFWFKRPALLLPWVRGVLFSLSFVFSSQVFFAWQFGPKSCYFTNAGFRAYAAWPFWVDTILAALLLLEMGLTTLPLYSLAVQMGSQYKHDRLSAHVKQALGNWLQRAKDKSAANGSQAAAPELSGLAGRVKSIPVIGEGLDKLGSQSLAQGTTLGDRLVGLARKGNDSGSGSGAK